VHELAAGKGTVASAQERARDLARVRGEPGAWEAIYAAEASAHGLDPSGTKPSATRRHRTRAPVAPSRSGGTGLAGFYDRHPKTVLASTVAVSTVGGIALNRTLGPLTDFDLQPSTIGATATLALGLLARHFERRRLSNVALASALGQGLATLEAHTHADEPLLRPRVQVRVQAPVV
jgi:hypothetical protein